MGYANPHAATSIGGATLTYDNNGNVTAIGSLDYTWDWRNRLASAERTGGSNTTYGYDHTGQRMFKATGMATTSYPSKYFNLATTTGSATPTKHIFSPGGELLATVVGASTTASTTYLHLDHLGGTNVATDENGEVTQTLDYYPFGAERISQGSNSTDRHYIGERYDSSEDLNYLNARYYRSGQGQFISQDPVFWEVGLTSDGKALLTNPQLSNSYSYATDNPILGKDPSGRCPWCLPFLVGGIGGGVSQYVSDVMTNRAAGMTIRQAFTSNLSSWQEYNAAVASGAITGAVATAGIVYGGVAATVGSAGQDWFAGRDVSLERAFATGVGTIATGGLFKWGVGPSPASTYMQATGRSFSTLPSAIFRSEHRYVTSGEIFGSSVNAIIQARYQQAQSYNASISSGSSAGGGSGSSLAGTHWVTPSGAVVSWEGSLIAGPVE
jgi:RHS repeat-associated protein